VSVTLTIAPAGRATGCGMCFRFDLCITYYSGRSNGVPFLWKFFCTTDRFAVTRLWSHPPHIFEDVANKIVRHVAKACMFGNSKLLQRHDSVHLSSFYTDYSFSSLLHALHSCFSFLSHTFTGHYK